MSTSKENKYRLARDEFRKWLGDDVVSQIREIAPDIHHSLLMGDGENLEYYTYSNLDGEDGRKDVIDELLDRAGKLQRAYEYLYNEIREIKNLFGIKKHLLSDHEIHRKLGLDYEVERRHSATEGVSLILRKVCRELNIRKYKVIKKNGYVFFFCGGFSVKFIQGD